MTQVVTVSATTAAYAAEAVKPSARLRGDGPADEAITLLSPRRADETTARTAAPTAVKTKHALYQALMLMSAAKHPPQESAAETLRRYLEYMREEESEQRQERQEEPADDEEQAADKVAAILDRFIQRE